MLRVSYFSMLLAGSFAFIAATAQVVTLDPPFPTQNDDVTITFNATQGNGALTGVVPVYMHTGVILEGQTGWQNVQGNWGTADANVLMTFVSPNVFQKTINISEFYNLQPGQVVEQLAFVFRNISGNIVGRDTDGSDIFVNISPGGFVGSILLPSSPQVLTTVPTAFDFVAGTSESATINMYLNDQLIESASSVTELSTQVDFTGLATGLYWLWMEALSDDGGDMVTDSTYVVLQGAPVVQAAPPGTKDGINYINQNTVVLQLHAPLKNFVYAIGDFNDWQFNPDYFLKKTPTGDRWWVQIDNLQPGIEYRFQYSIDEEDLRIADIYTHKVLDPWNDPWIGEDRYPGLIEYPTGKTNQIVSILQTDLPEYQWQVTDFQRPPKERLVIYELLVRDFTEQRTFKSLIDTLGYLERLGVNAIELLPINEFEGNESWGYNPSFYFAVDKYYGPADDLKAFIDACHARGIAVIVDVVFNHSFGQNPQLRMYSENGPAGPPLPTNPWFNVVPKHPFNVGYDYNHDSPHVQEFMKRNMHFWIEEFKVDGYRFDLSKGFTQNNTLGNVGAWNQFDQIRVNHWLRIRDEIHEVDNGVYLILEHLGDNPEETVLANAGFMLWGNMNNPANEATMGWPNSMNMNWANYQTRGWNQPNVVSYNESHDEERLIYKNLLFGNQANPDHDTRDLATALRRVEAINVLHFPLVGPKMLWQFGELGYDYSLNHCPDGTVNPLCRTANKPVRWDYWGNVDRQRLYKVTAAVNKLKTENEAFSSTNFTFDASGTGKRLIIQHQSMDVVIIANFNVNTINMVPGFTQTGTWYDYFTGDAIVETNLTNAFQLQPGEYRIYTTAPLETPDLSVVSSTENNTPRSDMGMTAYPNPFEFQTQITYKLDEAQEVQIRVVDLNGRVVANVDRSYKGAGNHMVRWNGDDNSGGKLPTGLYLIQILTKDHLATTKVVIQR